MKRILQLILVFSIVTFTGSYIVASKVSAEEHQEAEQKEKSKKTTAKDRVCGMKLEKDKAVKIKYEGKSYFFCSKDCEEKFHADPSKYKKKAKKKKEEIK